MKNHKLITVTDSHKAEKLRDEGFDKGRLRFKYKQALMGVGLAGVATLAAFGVMSTAGADAIALAFLTGITLSGSLAAFYRTLQRVSSQNIITYAIESDTQAVFITALPLDCKAPFIYTNNSS